MSVDTLKNDIKNNKIGRLYLFYGPEEYLKKYYTGTVEKLLLKEELKALNYIAMAGKVDPKRIMDCCDTMPVFSERKVVVVKNSGLFKSKKKGEGDGGKSKSNEFSEYLASLPEYLCLIFVEEEIDKRMSLVKTVTAHGLAVEFTLQKPAELVKWAVKVFKSFGKEIDGAAASQLVDFCEPGMNEILHEIEKIALYAEGRTKVTLEDVERVCTRSIKSRIFDLTDAMAEKKAARALQILDEMITLKEPVQILLFLIAKQFRQILEVKLYKTEGLSQGEVAAKLGLHPFVAGKLFKQAGNFSVEALKEAVKECLELDVSIKTGKINDRIAAEVLIGKYSA